MSVGRVTIPDQLYRLTNEENLPRAWEGKRISGHLKTHPEDFRVTEIPAFKPVGSGEFLYLFLEKTDLDTGTMLNILGEILGLKSSEIGYAGMKDKRAITAQWVSVPARVKGQLKHLEDHPQIRLLEVQRHEHGLRVGKLRGNSFDILIRTDTPQEVNLEPIVEKIRGKGIPNLFGEQRFGHRGQTASLGWALLMGEKSNRARKARRSRFMKKLALSAAQSLLFNRVVELRMEAQSLWSVMPGDVFQKSDTGGLFLSENPVEEQRRIDAGEINPTAPLFGRKDRWKDTPERELETRVWRESGFSTDAFDGWGKMALGTRRSIRTVPGDFTLERAPEGVRARFSLPAGSYATVLLRELYETSPQRGQVEP